MASSPKVLSPSLKAIAIGVFLLLSLLIFNLSFSQEGTVSSTLLDENNIPLPGATIIVKGTTTGTQTDFDGKYLISL
mgnify:CR=1 FL=1